MDWFIRTLRFKDGSRQTGATILRKTYTFAEVASRWDADDEAAALELPVSDGDYIAGYWEEANDLDGSVALNSVLGYLPGATTANVDASGEAVGTELTPNVGGTYTDTLDTDTAFGASSGKAKPGNSLYAKLTGSNAPTEGTITVGFLLLRG